MGNYLLNSLVRDVSRSRQKSRVEKGEGVKTSHRAGLPPNEIRENPPSVFAENWLKRSTRHVSVARVGLGYPNNSGRGFAQPITPPLKVVLVLRE